MRTSLPNVDQLARAILFEFRTDVRELALGGNDDAERALALAPAHVREVEAARRAFHEDGVDLLLGHQLLRLRDSRPPLVVGDRDDAGGHRLERGDCRGHGAGGGALRRRRRGLGGRATGDRHGSSAHRCGFEKLTTVQGHGGHFTGSGLSATGSPLFGDVARARAHFDAGALDLDLEPVASCRRASPVRSRANTGGAVPRRRARTSHRDRCCGPTRSSRPPFRRPAPATPGPAARRFEPDDDPFRGGAAASDLPIVPHGNGIVIGCCGGKMTGAPPTKPSSQNPIA